MKVGDTVIVTDHNPYNSEGLQAAIESRFPIGCVCTVEEVYAPSNRHISGRNKHIKDFAICDGYNIDFCKTVSKDKCICIKNELGQHTYICYLSIEKI